MVRTRAFCISVKYLIHSPDVPTCLSWVLSTLVLVIGTTGATAEDAAEQATAVPRAVDVPSESTSLVLPGFRSDSQSGEEALPRVPLAVVATDQPLSGSIALEMDVASKLTDEAIARWHVVVTSVDLGQAIDRATLTHTTAADESSVNSDQSATSAEPTNSNEPTSPEEAENDAGYFLNFRGTEVLSPGVYELRLQPRGSSSRWRDLLPWERDDSQENQDSLLAETVPRWWTLIVLPAMPARPSTGDPNLSQENVSRPCLVRWSGVAMLENDHHQSEEAATPATSRFSFPFGGSHPKGVSPSQHWANYLSLINQRLDTIDAASMNGIVVDSVPPDLRNDREEIHRLLLRYLHAHASQLGLAVWQIQANEETTDPTEAITLLRYGQPSGGGESADANAPPSTTLIAAIRLRPPAHTIRGQFPVKMRDCSGSDLIWFGSQTASTSVAPGSRETLGDLQRDGDSGRLKSGPSVYPLTHLDAAFAANAWLTDWARWCLASTQSSGSEARSQPGLLINESLLNGEVIPPTVSVREAAQLWRFAWADDSRWLARKRSADARGKIGSFVSVRHANIGGGSTLVCFNQSPWPMKVTFPLDQSFQWDSQAPAAIASIRLTQPSSGGAGETALVIPANSILVCHSHQRISESLRFTVEMEDAPKQIDRLTRQVTTIVESLGLLGELSGLTSTRTTPARHWARAQDSVSRLASTKGGGAPPSSASGAATTPGTGWSIPFWSTQGWGGGRSPAPDPNTATSSRTRIATVGAVTDQLGNPSTASSGKHSDSPPAQCRNLLRNGGFEEQQQLGIPGWMHAHHPADAVVIDTLIRSQGRHAVRMKGTTAAGASSWLISREIAKPIGGRIGISMSIYGAAPQSDDKQTGTAPGPELTTEIRVAIEGECDGQPIRHSKMVPVNHDGKWRLSQLVLEWLDVDPQRVLNLRVTIDNFSSTPVWIDNIVVTDYFASGGERTSLQSLAYLAVQGLQHSDFQASARLLNHFWAKDLLRISRRITVSQLESTESEKELSGNAHTRLSFQGTGLPTPMWSNNAKSAPMKRGESPGGRAKSLAPPPTDSIPSSPAGDSSAEHSSTQSAVGETPPSIAGRIRSWLPAPLRF